MTLLDRYLYQVRLRLPKAQAADIVAEIADDLQSQFEERENPLGRPLTEDEEAELIKAYGHPNVVAARYSAVQYLIGPESFPFYFSALRLVATVVIAIELLGGAIGALVSHNGAIFFAALGAAWNSLIWIFGIVTIVFAISERVPHGPAARLPFRPSNWDPRRLPAPGVLPPVSRGSALIEFIVNFIALLAILDAPGPVHHIPLDAIIANVLRELHLTLTPAWHGAYIGTLTGTALIAISAITVFIRPQLSSWREIAVIAGSLATMAGLAFTLKSGPWIQPSNATLDATILYTLVSAIVIFAVNIALSIRAFLRKTSNAVLMRYS